MSFSFVPYSGYLRCTCHDKCPYHPKFSSTMTTTAIFYTPKHRKPGPAR